MIEVPSISQVAAYCGWPSRKAWRELPNDWHCPSCRRGKFQLIRYVKVDGKGHTESPGKGSANLCTDTARGFGWRAGIHKHHDHVSVPEKPSRYHSKFQYCKSVSCREAGIRGHCAHCLIGYQDWLLALEHWNFLHIPKFRPTYICSGCNTVEPKITKALGLKNFTLSPEEIGQFIAASPHGPVKIDKDRIRGVA